ncbi:MAG TPA: hypothetical protein VFB62_01805 [Polyangiaceae bacterium]|jgi:hypothetical protein|nr:hypothetical protein [Polyangiaceae bacterium]
MFELLVVPVALAVILFGRVAQRNRLRQRLDQDLDGWAQALGMVRVGTELHGERHGVAVGARLALEKKGKHAPLWTLMARLAPPLDLGLMLHPGGAEFEDITGGAPFVPIGDRRFDARFIVRADEPERAQALLDEPLRQQLVQMLDPRAVFMLTDHGVAFQTHIQANFQWLNRALEVAATIAHSINRARDQVPVASVLAEHRHAWQRFAQRSGLTGIGAPLCMWGRMAGATVYAYSVRLARKKYCLEIWLRFEEPLGLGLLIQPMSTLDRMKDLFAAEDYKLGEEIFDETFLVRVSNPEGAVALLDQATREKLLALHRSLGPLSLTDEGLLVRLPRVPPDPAIVPSMVGQLLELATHIAQRRSQQRGGPYR